jgi:hypothetical protein
MIKKITILLSCITFASCTQQPSKSPLNKRFAPTATIDILYAKSFKLNQGYWHDWSKERPFVKEGMLIVLKVNPDLVRPTNALQPVLFAGNQTVQRLNHGFKSGHVIGIIPGQVDLSKTPIWFGHPALPEQVSTKTIGSESNFALTSNIKAFSKNKISNISQGDLTAENLAELLRKDAADLVLEYSPTEKYLAENWRMTDAK